MKAPTLRDSVVRIIADAFPQFVYSYPRTYVVNAVRSDKRLDLVAPTDAKLLPPLNAVEQWGLGKVTPAVGSLVCVMFRDAKRARAMVVPWDFGSTPAKVNIDATAKVELGHAPTRGAARLNDVVTSTLPPATFVGTIGGSPASGMVIWPGSAMGTVTTASSKVEAE